MRRNKEQYTSHYLGERSQPSAGRGRRPYNRLCLDCLKTYPGNDLSGDKTKNYSGACGCGGELVSISCRARVPRRTNKRAWKKFLRRWANVEGVGGRRGDQSGASEPAAAEARARQARGKNPGRRARR